MQCWMHNNIEQSTKAETRQQDYELLLLPSCSCSRAHVHTTQKWFPQKLLTQQGSTEKTVNIFKTHGVSKWSGLRIRNIFSPNVNILPSFFHGLCHWSKNSLQTTTSCPSDSTDRHRIQMDDTPHALPSPFLSPLPKISLHAEMSFQREWYRCLDSTKGTILKSFDGS